MKTAYDYHGPKEGEPFCTECGSRHALSYNHPEDRLQGSNTKDGGYGYGFEYDAREASAWVAAQRGAGK